ncbi:MAG: aminopeptidase N [Pseudomonadota bacterium]
MQFLAGPSVFADPLLTFHDAEQRAARVAAVDYILEFKFDETSPEYEGSATITFELNDTSTALALDYSGDTAQRLSINGTIVAKPQRDQHRIMLAPKYLQIGPNQVQISFRNAYSTDGNGLHRALDAADGHVYLFTNLEPYLANRVFPCFDQPDLKAAFTVSVNAPSSWQIVANAPTLEANTEGAITQHRFAKTERFSTYLFALIAGPFRVWEDAQAKYPSRILAVQSMAQYVDAEALFDLTREGMRFFESYFDIAYPFRKYDQIFVPEFNPGAMENVGAVIFNDRYIYRHEPTKADLMRRANTLLHEMAHMWFGNMVTMRWWNDLWLNESFATYMAHLAMAEATRFSDDAWDSFARSKGWAYWQDQLPTTHPIETPVPDTLTAFSNFDGITYSKGSSVLKQLAFRVGPDNFRRGVSKFLKDHLWRNASRADFVNAIATAAGLDLTAWSRQWLRTAGINTLAPRYAIDASGKIVDFEIVQGPGNGDKKLREHRLKIALFDRQGSELTKRTTLDANIDSNTQEIAGLEGQVAPDFIYVNYEDYAYAKVFLDERSIDFAMAHMEKLPANLRTAAWQGVWYMVRDEKISPTVYLDLFLAKAGLEDDANLIDSFRYRLQPALNSYISESLRADYMSRAQTMVWERLHNVPAGSDLQKSWFKYFVATVTTAGEQNRLADLLNTNDVVPGLTIDQEKRWSIINRLAVLGYPQAEKLLGSERQRDPSSRGQQNAYAAQVSLPDPKIKADAWQEFVSGDAQPLNLLRAGMRGFFQREQRELTERYADEYFSALPGLASTHGHYYVRAFGGGLFPYAFVDPKILERSEILLKEENLPDFLKRTLLEANDGLARALRIREAFD